MVAPAPRPLTLTAPWYRWQRQRDDEGLFPRSSRPVFQKFDGRFVDLFLEDPQRSFRFTPEDHAHVLEGSPFTSPIRRLADVRRERADLRKLFRGAHRRFYLAVAELHCTGPGLPDSDAVAACEMGLVIRRRAPSDPAAVRARMEEVREQIGVDRAQVLSLQWARAGVAGRGTVRTDPRNADPGSAFFRPSWETDADRTRLLGLYRSELDDLRDELRDLRALDPTRVASRTEIWIPDPDREGRGRWEPLTEEAYQGSVREKVHPVQPLRMPPRRVPDPTQGATLLFGAVPTDDGDLQADGVPRFDGTAVYEARIFVRRHDPACPRSRDPDDCKGPLVWSRATEPFQIAPQDDVDGTAHHTVTIPMPNLEELATALPPGGVRMTAPEGSNLQIEADGSDVSGGSLGGAQICTLPILLITLVARFLFALFLPVVVLAFQLFFLLRLKLCIPPSVEIRAELDAAVAAAGPSIDASVQVRAELEVQFNEMFGAPAGGPGPGTDLVAEYGNQELLDMLDAMTSHAGPEPPVGGGDELLWEERVEERPPVDDPALVAAVS